jgi:hypothetical protein
MSDQPESWIGAKPEPVWVPAWIGTNLESGMTFVMTAEDVTDEEGHLRKVFTVAEDPPAEGCLS